MAGGGVSGLAVGLTAAGGVLVTAAIRNQPPLDVLKIVLRKTPSGASLGPSLSTVKSGVTPVQAVAGLASNALGAAGAAAAGAGVTNAGGALIGEAQQHLGARYVFGATGPTTFDCSGLVVYCLRKTLIPNCKRFTTVNVSSYLKSQGWVRVGPSEFQSGDVIIRAGHMGIAISNTRLIHAPHTGTVVKEADIFDKKNWWGYRPR